MDARRDRVTDKAETSSATFVALYRRYAGPIYSYFYRRVGNRADAEDLTEQVFMEALEKLETYEAQGKVGAWLFTIAHSRVVDYYRRQRYHLPFDEKLHQPGYALGPEHEVVRREEAERLFALLDRLEADRQELILLRFGAELSYQEIGRIVGKSEAAVKMATYRLLEELRASWYVNGASKDRMPEANITEDNDGR